MSFRKSLMLTALGIAVGGSAARAEAPAPGSFYATIGGKVEFQNLPRYVSNLFDPSGNPVGSFRPDALVAGPTGAIGYVLPAGSVPAWLGNNFRLELAGGWQGGGGREHSTTRQRAGGGRYYTLTGTVFGYGFAGGATTDSALSVNHDQWKIELVAKSDYALAPRWSVTPFFAVGGGATNTRYFLRELTTFFGVGFSRQLLDERAQMWHVGARAGGQLAWQATAALKISLGGFVGFAHQEARYTGQNCVGFLNSEFTTCDVPGVFAAATSAVTNSSTTLAFLGGAGAGAAYDLGWATISLGGHFSYNSKTPGIRHPSAADPRAAGLVYTGEFAYGGHLKITIPLP